MSMLDKNNKQTTRRRVKFGLSYLLYLCFIVLRLWHSGNLVLSFIIMYYV